MKGNIHGHKKWHMIKVETTSEVTIMGMVTVSVNFLVI